MIEIASPSRPQLLVSVQDACEARLAHSLGVPWIDLKNPALGSLGCPDVTTATQVARTLAASGQAPKCQTSVALGELRTLNIGTAIELMQLFPIAKVGLAGLATAIAATRVDGQTVLSIEMFSALDKLARSQHSAGQLVLAAYADFQRAAAPSPVEVIELARQFGARHVLIDTYQKDGLGLFHWQSPTKIASLRERAAAIGAELVVAGSLTSADWPALREAAPAIVGVRGGVCTRDRASELCPERIAQWLEWTRN